MKITTNPIGNYSLNKVRNTAPKTKINVQTENKAESLTKSEKNFFVGIYPESKSEIMKYHFYNANGKFGGVAIGNNIDRRG